MTRTVSSAARWRLISITVREFRGVAKERCFEFNGRPGLLHGNNGVGKSTVALALQWILYGHFPSGVLQNASPDRFLSPVHAKNKGYSGEVLLGRGKERLTILRDAAKKDLKVSCGGETWLGAAAEARRDALLGLDMDSFSRAVLLQQSRVRGILLDDPKERNKALDRLLGMDAVEHLLELLRPKDFSRAAVALRRKSASEQERFDDLQELLGDQLATAQQRARTLKFLNKDLNPTGLRTRCAELGRDLVALGNKYHVDLTDLPACADPASIDSFSKALTSHAQRIRTRAQLRQQLAPVEKAISTYTALRDSWVEQHTARDDKASIFAKLVKKHGERETILETQMVTGNKLQELRRELQSANDTRQLIDDARALLVRENLKSCPVCEQVFPMRSDIVARLKARSLSLASKETNRIETRVVTEQNRMTAAEESLAVLKEGTADLNSTQKDLDALRMKVIKALGGSGISESKILVRLDEALRKHEGERAAIADRIDLMEQDIGELELRHGALREGLLPVIVKREELAAHEAAGKKAKDRHARDEARAGRMDDIAEQIDVIRKALLSAKQHLAGESLRKAGPRAQALYRTLVKQPVFDTLTIQTTPRANKVDYTFTVSTKAAIATARDARLVLSDGQLTATALSLFFALAESAGHELDLLYVDDPTQNLDHPCKEAMAKVITELAQHRQIIVSTHDEDFVSFLQAEGFSQGAVVHHIKSWNGTPTIETSSPS